MSLSLELRKRKELVDLEKELRKLRKSLNYKNSSFCQSKLDDIIKNYFGEEYIGRKD